MRLTVLTSVKANIDRIANNDFSGFAHDLRHQWMSWHISHGSRQSTNQLCQKIDWSISELIYLDFFLHPSIHIYYITLYYTNTTIQRFGVSSFCCCRKKLSPLLSNTLYRSKVTKDIVNKRCIFQINAVLLNSEQFIKLNFEHS